MPASARPALQPPQATAGGAVSGWLSRAPAPPLDLFFDTLWTSARSAGLAHRREWALPTGRADLVVPLDRPAVHRYANATDATGHWLAGGVLQGAMERPTLRDTGCASVVVGAHCLPHGLPALWPGSAAALCGHSLALDALWPGWTARLQARVHAAGALHDAARRLALFEAALRERLLHTALPEPLLPWAWAQLQHGHSVGAVQRASGLSPARFIARFRDGCGLTPKRLLALQRLRTAAELAHRGQAWVLAAHEAGYADQAHLAREVRRFTGHTPGQLRAGATAFATHWAATVAAEK